MGHHQPHDPSDHRSPASTQHGASQAQSKEQHASEVRPWLTSAGASLLIVGVIIAASVLINPLLGRYIHWRRIDLGAPVLFLGFAAALRRRWL